VYHSGSAGYQAILAIIEHQMIWDLDRLIMSMREILSTQIHDIPDWFLLSADFSDLIHWYVYNWKEEPP